jgi:hypothetical protein
MLSTETAHQRDANNFGTANVAIPGPAATTEGARTGFQPGSGRVEPLSYILIIIWLS